MGTTTWLVFALLAPVLWSASNLIDEGLVRGTPLRPWTLVMISGSFASLPALLLAVRWSWPGWLPAGLAVCTGALSVLVYFPYFTALATESAARVVLMWNLTPVLVLAFAAAFIGERISSTALVAVLLLVAGSLVAAYRGEAAGRWSSAFGWMVLASVLMALESVMEKRIYQEVPFLTGLMWLSVGALLTTFTIMALAPTSRARLRSVYSGRLGSIVFANEMLNLIAAWSLSFATSLGPVALVTAVGGLQPVFVLFFQGAARRQQLSRVDLARLVGSCALATCGLRLLGSSF